MELLYFLGQDTPINIIQDETLMKKAVAPAINIHIRTGGVSLEDIEGFLDNDTDEYFDMIYLTIPKKLQNAYYSKSLQWLLTRNHDEVCHMLICHNSLYDRLHYQPFMKWMRKDSIVQELLKCYSPFSRLLSNTSEHNVDLYDVSGITLSKQAFYFSSKKDNAKPYCGCFVDDWGNTPQNVALDFECFHDYKDYYPTLDHLFTYEYTSDDIYIRSRRPLSSIVSSLSQLSLIDVYIVTQDMVKVNTKLLHQLEDLRIPFTLVKQEPLPNNHRVHLVLHDTVVLHNASMLLNLLRKCPSFSSFSTLLLHSDIGSPHNPNKLSPLFKQHLINESFVECACDDETLNNAQAYLQTYVVKGRVLLPLITPCCCIGTDDVSANTSKKDKTYFVHALGDDDLAEQMIQYASTINAFHVSANVHKESWNLIKLKSAFQNVEYSVSPPVTNSFTLMHQPTFYPFVFHSRHLDDAKRYLSALNHYDVIIGVHRKRTRLSESKTADVSVAYYKKAIEHFKSLNEQKHICFVLCQNGNEGINLTELFPNENVATEDGVIINNYNTNDSHFELVDDDLTTLAVLSMCDGLILSTSTFAWWAAMLSQPKKTKNIVAPKHWLNSSYLYRAQEEHHFHQESWTLLDN